MSTSDPTRDDPHHDLGQRLLCSMAMDVPPRHAKAATLAALGLAVAGVTVGTTASAATALVEGSVAGEASAVGSGSVALGKLGAVAGSAGVLGTGAAKTALLATLVGAVVGTVAIETGIGISRWSRTQPSAAESRAERTRSSVAVESRGARASGKPVAAALAVSAFDDGSRTNHLDSTLLHAQGSSKADHSDLDSPNHIGDNGESDRTPMSARLPGKGIEERNAEPRRAVQSTREPRPEESSKPEAPASSIMEGSPIPAHRLRSTLPRETAQLDLARAALRRGDTALALSELERYNREFPAGALRPEAEVLHIEVALRAGDATRARVMAESFIARSPSSPHVVRLRKLLGI